MRTYATYIGASFPPQRSKTKKNQEKCTSLTRTDASSRERVLARARAQHCSRKCTRAVESFASVASFPFMPFIVITRFHQLTRQAQTRFPRPRDVHDPLLFPSSPPSPSPSPLSLSRNQERCDLMTLPVDLSNRDAAATRAGRLKSSRGVDGGGGGGRRFR